MTLAQSRCVVVERVHRWLDLIHRLPLIEAVSGRWKGRAAGSKVIVNLAQSSASCFKALLTNLMPLPLLHRHLKHGDDILLLELLHSWVVVDF